MKKYKSCPSLEFIFILDKNSINHYSSLIDEPLAVIDESPILKMQLCTFSDQSSSYGFQNNQTYKIESSSDLVPRNMSKKIFINEYTYQLLQEMFFSNIFLNGPLLNQCFSNVDFSNLILSNQNETRILSNQG
jgi:hypothetical protein